MRALINLFWSICFLRRGPQDVPYSLPLLILFLLVNGLMSWYQFSFRTNFADALLSALLMQGILASFSYLVLALKGYPGRFLQTMTTLLGVNTLINVFVLPIIVIAPSLIHPEQAPALLVLFSMVFIIFSLGLSVWLLVVTAHVYRHALNVNFMVGLLVAIALMGTDILVFKTFIH